MALQTIVEASMRATICNANGAVIKRRLEKTLDLSLVPESLMPHYDTHAVPYIK
jgi:hypothetical protein